MKLSKAFFLAPIVLLAVGAVAQEFPRYEIGGNYSYVRYIPSASQTNNHSLNGGGGTAVVNLNSYLGIKMDLQGYGSMTSNFLIPPSINFPGGANGSVSGNLFTYLFGPQIKFRTPKVQPYAQVLLGGAHSNVYANAFSTICQPAANACAFTGSPSSNAFAMAVGGGIDVPITKLVSIRPAEVDYLLTDFSNRFTNSNQNNFRYLGGVTFTFGR